jgi:hypothetical protein
MARKMTRKARAAALRNLAKARRARKRKHGSHVKSPRRKHRVSKAQRAAARRNIKKAIAGKRRKKACRKAAGKRGAAKRAGRRMPGMPKACKPKRKKGRRRVKATGGGKRKSAKRVAAGKKAARTRKRHKAERAKASRKGHRKTRKHGKRKAHRKTGSKRKSAKRVRAGKKAARTRKHHVKVDHQSATPGSDAYYAMERGKKRKKRRKGRRRNPVAALALANPIRRRHHRRRNPINPFMVNPIQGPAEFIAGLFGVGMGYVAANLVDRLLATHPLVSTTSGYVDSPAAGSIYDSEAPLTPIWSSPVRFIAGVGMIFVPGVLSRFVPGGAAKAFLQLASYGAAAQVAGKAISDGIAAFAPSNPLVLQVYGGEVAAQAKLAAVGGGSLWPTANAPGFAGAPRMRQLGAPAKVGCGGNCGGGCGGGCSSPISSDPVADAQNAQSSGQPFFATSLDSGSLDWQSDPNVSDPGADCAPMPVTAPTLNPMPGGGPPPTVPPVTTQLPPVVPVQTSQNCPPGQIWDPSIGCVTPGGDAQNPNFNTPPGVSANGNPPPTSQTTPTRIVTPTQIVTPSTSPVTAVPHIIA